MQHSRLPCPSLSPRVCSNSRPLSWWCYLTLSSSVILFFSFLNISQHQDLFQWVSSSHKVARVLEFQLQHQFFWWISRVDFLQDWLVCSSCCPRDSQASSKSHHSSKPSVLLCSAFSVVQLSHPSMTTGKTIALTRQTIVCKVMYLLFKMLSRFVMNFQYLLFCHLLLISKSS